MSLTSAATSSESNNVRQDDSSDEKDIIRVMVLHGSEGSGQEFELRLQPLRDAMPQLQIHSFNAPFAKGGGFSWWKLGPGERSFCAETYPGFDASLNLATEQMNQIQPHLVLAHSQGAIFMAALLALQHTTTTTVTSTTIREPKSLPQNHPELGYILNGLAWPNPFAPHFFQLLQDNSGATMDITADADNALIKPRILVIVGQADTINPPSSAERVVQHFQHAGFPISTLYHEGGHSVPFRNETNVAAVADWIQQGLSSLQ